MEKIISWLNSCGYTNEEAIKEANSMVRCNMYKDHTVYSREYAIQMILEEIED